MFPPIRTKLAVLVGGLACLALGAAFASTFDWTPSTIAQTGHSNGSTASLRTIGNTFTQIAHDVTPAVVSVRSDRVVTRRMLRDFEGMPPLDEFFRFETPPGERAPQEEERAIQGSGSGVVVRQDGYIVTNNHVVAEARRIQVVLNDGRTFDATLVGRDPSTDIAVLKIDAGDLPVARLAADDAVEVGEWVLAFGNPFGLDFTMTAGIVSAIGRQGLSLPQESPYAIQDFIQTDAAINPGNSGGPLVNIDGEVIGINAAIASGTGAYQGYGFAIPIAIVRRVVDQLIETGEVRRAVLGVSIQPITPLDAQALGLGQARGVLVADFDDRVQPNPARQAGIQPGDVVLQVEGQPVNSVGGLQQAIAFHEAGDEVELRVWRDGDERTIKVRLAARPSVEETQVSRTQPMENGEHESALGMEVQDVTPQVRQTLASQYDLQQSDIPAGVLVRDVEPIGPASDARLDHGAIITQIGDRPVGNLDEYRDVVDDLDEGDVVRLWVYHPSIDARRFHTLRVGR
jgi:serine protease Do